MNVQMKISVSGLNGLLNKFSQSPKQVGRAIASAIAESAAILEREAKIALTEGPTRAIDTGLLRSQNVIRELTSLSASVYPLVDYAFYVHEGTYKMRARPWMVVAAKAAKPTIISIFERHINGII